MIIFGLLLVFGWCLIASYGGPEPLPHTRKKNKEIVAIEAAKEMREKHRLHTPTLASKPLLIATFMNASKLPSRVLLFNNIYRTYEQADFVVILYDGDHQAVTRFCNPKNIHPPAFASVIHCRRATVSYSSRHRFIPKPLLYTELLPYLPRYRKTMLLDEDISLSEFNINEFLAIWDCAFYPSHPPMIVQGLLAEPTQYFPFVHYSEWQKHGNLTSVIASGTDFVEQQMPAFDSMFLFWFIEHAMVYFLSAAFHYETDWGADGHWCSAARSFAHHYYGIKYGLPNNQQYVPCALITGTLPFHHKDTRSLNWLKANYDAYHAAGTSVVELWRSYFPSWKVEYEDPIHIDPTKSFRPYRKSYVIPNDCPLQVESRN